jgi:UDP-GlcNAc:undecaprenyl-phosphate GlcNAc-1-phosphate transferase
MIPLVEPRFMITYGIAFVSAASLSGAFTFLVRKAAERHGWTCKRPITDRDIHRRAVPRLGGVAIAAAFLVVVAAFGRDVVQLSTGEITLSRIALLVIPGALICAVGLYDDFSSISVPQKLLAQVVTAVVLFVAGYKVFSLPLLFGPYDFGIAASLGLTIFWVVLVTNSFNLIDGVDGLSAGTGWISVMVLFVVAALDRQHSVAFLAAVLAGTILGFLPFNFSPANVFLGDCGSLFIGFMLSALALAGTQKAVVALVVPLVCFAVPLLDTTLAVIRRFLNNKPLFAADREHIHHKLLEKGLSQRQVALLLYGVSATFGFLSLALLRPSSGKIVLVVVVAGVIAAVGIRRLGYNEFAELGMATRRTIHQKQTIASNLALRRAITGLKTATTLPEICNNLDEACKASDFEYFEITLEAPGALAADLKDKSLRLESNKVRFTCFKHPNVLRPWDSMAGWTLRLDLIIDDCYQGNFVAYRPYEARALTVEMNLLVADFRIALVRAVDRAVRRFNAKSTPGRATSPGQSVLQQQLRNSIQDRGGM